MTTDNQPVSSASRTMTTETHTPEGPFNFVTSDNGLSMDGYLTDPAIDGINETIFLTDVSNPEEEYAEFVIAVSYVDQPNTYSPSGRLERLAHNIKAAPDLLEALKDLLTATQPQHTLRHVFIGEAQEAARAAIAKAEGRS